MLRLLFGGLIGAALAYYLDPAMGRRRRESALAQLDAEGLAAASAEFDRIKERVHENWSAITDDQIEKARGNLDELIAIIRAKTGETVESIREQLYGLRRTESGVPAR
jgi:gas vesicle protein